MKDALGNELVIGRTYGYSRSDNGVTTVKIGKLVKINERMVSLGVSEAKTAIYSDELTADRFSTKKTVSVKANGLFPINDFNIGDKVTCKQGYNHGEIFVVTGIKEKQIEVTGDWSGGTHCVWQSDWINKEDCKIYKK
jgi:hypothetical protein